MAPGVTASNLLFRTARSFSRDPARCAVGREKTDITYVLTKWIDPGARHGDEVARKKITVRNGPDIPGPMFGALEYFRAHTARVSSVRLVDHRGTNLQLRPTGMVNVAGPFAVAGNASACVEEVLF